MIIHHQHMFLRMHMQYALGLVSIWIVRNALFRRATSESYRTAKNAPKFTATNLAYSKSVDPGPSDGYADQWLERAGAHWSFRPISNGSDDDSAVVNFPASKPAYPASSPRHQPSPAVPFDQSLVLVVSGVAASSDLIEGAEDTDKAIRLLGDDHSCVKIEGLSVEDSCLLDPSTCNLKADGVNGFSLSLWLNMPDRFDSRARFIFDTGATETGYPGVTISYVSSLTGSDFNPQITVLVSTGSHYWQVVLDGMLKPYEWSNLGIRWSADVEPSSGLPFGLQVFVDKVPVVWTRSPTTTSSNSTTTATGSADIRGTRWTVGCGLDGTGAMVGRLDELAVWYWRLRDSSTAVKNRPSNPGEYGELELFDGNLKFLHLPVPCLDISCLPGDVVAPPSVYLLRNSKSDIDENSAGDRDTMPAIEGDCRQVDPSSWKGDGMIYCVDTVKELKEAIASTPTFKALPFLKAVVRIVNKAPGSLIQQDIDDLYTIMTSKGIPQLRIEIGENTMDPQNATAFMDVVYIISKLSELGKYNDLWHTEEMTNKQPGITNWNKLCDQWLTTVGLSITPNATSMGMRYRAANHTAAALFKAESQQVTRDITFPNYDSDFGSADEAFWKYRNGTWGQVADSVTIPLTRLSVYQKYTPLTMVMKIHNILDKSVPGFLDQRVTGIGNAGFFVNSRILSFFAYGNISEQSTLKNHTVMFSVMHLQQQDDRPFMKAAIICVRWRYSDSGSGIGAWDPSGCGLINTNDLQSTCQCSDNGDYAILMENHFPPDAIDANYYNAAFVLNAVSIICLVIFIITAFARKGLHYEMHFVHSNLAFAMLLALVFYASTMKASQTQTTCVIISAFLQYAYTSAYAWFALAAHYACRAVISGQLGRVLFSYTLLGWGLPGVIVTVCVAIRIDLYGFGSRCLVSQSQHFLSIYIGSFLALCALVLPLLLVAACNVRGKHWASRNPADWSDVKSSLLGITVLWPMMTAVWLMAICVYLVPLPYQTFDFLFEILNAIQGILILIFLGFAIPSFRQAFFCRRKYEEDLLLAEENRRKQNEQHPYFD